MGELGLSLGSRWKFYHKVLRLIETGICSSKGQLQCNWSLQIASSPITWPSPGGWPPPLSPGSFWARLSRELKVACSSGEPSRLQNCGHFCGLRKRAVPRKTTRFKLVFWRKASSVPMLPGVVLGPWNFSLHALMLADRFSTCEQCATWTK